MPLSAKVRARIDARNATEAAARKEAEADRARKRQRVFSLSMTAVSMVALCISAWYQHRLWKQNTAPTWAGFTMSGVAESVPASDGFGPPYQLVVNGELWSLVQVKSFVSPGDANAEATTDCQHRTIAYIEAEDPVEQRVALLHEIYHAGGCLHGGDTWWNSEHPTKHYHPGIVHISEFTAIFLRDNPAFTRWLLREQ